ncbi:MAG: protein kinase [Desulfurivibrio sp.]
MWQPNDIVLDHYRVETVAADPTGEGGALYGCRHLSRPFRALLETPPPRLLTSPAGLRQIITRAEQRIRLGMHPNLAAAFNLRFTRRLPVLIGEAVAGESLAERLAAKGCGHYPRIDLSLAIQFCHALEYCHHLGIIHGRLSPAAITITPNSLLKVTGFGLAGADEQLEPSRLQALISEDIRAFGICLWQIFCATPPYIDRKRPGKPQPVNPALTFPVPLQVALLRSTASDSARRYRNFAELRRDLNLAYRELFKIPCPYFAAPHSDYRAEILNNQAVMLLEEGKERAAAQKLARSLEINDTLPEAVHNDLLCRWRLAGAAPARILGRIQANYRPQLEQPGLVELERAVTLQLSGLKDDPDKPGPQFRMIAPADRLAVYRHGPSRRNLEKNISDHLRQRRYQACYDLLLAAWSRTGFHKDKFYNRIYGELLMVREKKQPLQAQRFLKLSGHQSPVIALATIPCSRRIASLGADGRLIIHDLESSGKPKLVENRELKATCMAVCPEGKHLAMGDREGSVRLLSPRDGEVTGQGQRHPAAVGALTFSHDGKLLASGGEDGSIMVRRLSTGSEHQASPAAGGSIRALLYPGDGLELISGGEDGVVRAWKSRLRECAATINAHAGPLNALAAVGGTEGENLLISAGDDCLIKIWQRPDDKCRQTLAGHGERIRALHTLADDQTLISAGEDDLIRIWDLTDGANLFTLDGRGDGVCSLGRGPRPHTFLAGRADGIINIWMLIHQLDFDLI